MASVTRSRTFLGSDLCAGNRASVIWTKSPYYCNFSSRYYRWHAYRVLYKEFHCELGVARPGFWMFHAKGSDVENFGELS